MALTPSHSMSDMNFLMSFFNLNAIPRLLTTLKRNWTHRRRTAAKKTAEKAQKTPVSAVVA